MKPFNYYDLIESFAVDACPICALTRHDVARHLDSHLYEYANTRETHATMRASRGLCAHHSQQLADYPAGVLGVAILHQAVLDELLTLTDTPVRANGGFSRWMGGANAALADRLEPTATCFVCDALERAEALHIRALADHILEPRLTEAYRASRGLCLPHFRQSLRAAPSTAAQERLTALQSDIWRALKAELDAFTLKYDVNHADLVMGAEADSWRRATEALGGDPFVLGLRRKV